MRNEAEINREAIEQILREEDKFFVDCHCHRPIGRESEDVVDNAYTRIQHVLRVPYEVVSEIYTDMLGA